MSMRSVVSKELARVCKSSRDPRCPGLADSPEKERWPAIPSGQADKGRWIDRAARRVFCECITDHIDVSLCWKEWRPKDEILTKPPRGPAGKP